MKELALSPAVEKCLRVTPKGGITAQVITDKSQLSKRALQTLSRWARMTEDVVEDGYESGYDDDPVEVGFLFYLCIHCVLRLYGRHYFDTGMKFNCLSLSKP